VVEAIGENSAIIVGHDWGAPIAANSALLRPDVFRALALLSVPYSPRGARRPTDAFREMGGKEEFYIQYFQQPGRAEAEIEPDVRGWLLGFYYCASGDAPPPAAGGTMATISHGGKMRDRLTIPEKLPGWLTAEDLDFYVSEFERTGLTGGLNRYRNVDRDWEDLAAFTASRSPCRRCSSAARRTGRHDGVARRSLTSARHCRGCVARMCSADAAIGCSRSGLGMSTSCWSNS
jgi:pimeloyl-ACP methyl ester carboxylesterase